MSELSPAAQAVNCAIADRLHRLGGIASTQKIVAAALRAAADQVGEWESAEELRAIATELENYQ